MEYQPQEIEQKWRKYWQDHQTYKVENRSEKPKYYVLDMFPYPSGSGLHVGHPLGYVASDIYTRYKRLKGFNVLHPMGYDAFGLPAEQYAIQTGIHPAASTQENIARYRAQLDNLGLSFDWDRQVNTSEPAYYRWTQHIFLLLFDHYYDTAAQKAKPIADLVVVFEQEGNAGVQAHADSVPVFTAADWQGFTALQKQEILMSYRLAYRKVGYVNWCEALGSVLANDEVVNGVSERGGYPVVKREMVQWSLRITAYAERLLQGLDTVDFSESIKTQQRNWIGRSEGARLRFQVANSDHQLEVFTTRPDTVFGCSFMVLAPEHELVCQIATEAQRPKIAQYLEYTQSRSERDRLTEVKRVTGEFTGAYAQHPFTGELLPIWISEYVLAGYGTGAIMAVPAEDDRDNRFAQHFQLPILPILDKSAFPNAEIGDKVGVYINSDFLNGLTVAQGIPAAIQAIEAKGLGRKLVNYKLRDANFSRQRYWGEPFPIAYDEQGLIHKAEELPVTLPPLDNFKPTSDGRSPLARAEEWLTMPQGWKRELDTMPGFAGSSWYFLRYMDPHNEQAMFSQEAVNYWQQVDLYVGGAEHAVGHLLYSRFWHKFLHDLGLVPTEEPYRKLINQGMIQGIVEYIFLLKEKRDGHPVFVCDEVGMAMPEDQVAKVHVRSDLVLQPSGGILNAYLDQAGIDAFKAWMPEYADAIFEVNAQGQLTTYSEVGKMSKRYHNVVNPDDVVNQYGADAFRLYEMFLGPLEQSKPWDSRNIEGTFRFLKRLWSLFYNDKGQLLLNEEQPNADELKVLHLTIKKVSTDLENFSFNTCVAHFMTAVNELKKLNCSKKAILQDLVLLLAPFAPHLAEELWLLLGHAPSVHQNGQFPQWKEEYLVSDSIEYPIQINGKVRAKKVFPANATEAEIQAVVQELDEVLKWLEGKSIKKIIVVPKRMINVVLG